MNFLKRILGAREFVNEAKNYFMIGLDKQKAKDFQGAIESYNKAIELNKNGDSSNIYYNRGNAKSAIRDFEGAIADYTKSINESDNKKFFDVYFNRGNAYFDLFEFPKAIDDYTNAITLNNQYARGYTNRAKSYIETKQYKEAALDFKTAIGIDTHELNFNNTYSLATALDNLNDLSGALTWYEAVLLFNKNLDSVKERVSEIKKILKR